MSNEQASIDDQISEPILIQISGVVSPKIITLHYVQTETWQICSVWQKNDVLSPILIREECCMVTKSHQTIQMVFFARNRFKI